MRFHATLGLAALLTTASANAINQRQLSPTPSIPSSTGSDNGPDKTVTRTTTITPDGGSTVTKKTTTTTTVLSTVLITKTEFSTTTVTQAGKGVATKTIIDWVTVTTNVKRSLTEPTLDARNALFKRATVTTVKTVTADGGDGVTKTETNTDTITRPTSSETTTTSVDTETVDPGATTTTTVHITRTTTQTNVATDAPTSPLNPGEPDSGLSTGAKAGIGAGVGVAGLAIIAGLLWLCLRRKKEPKEDPYDMTGSSMVPVGGAGASRPVAENSYLAPARNPVKAQPSPEGYRGTAMGDGRAGYAKPDAYGPVYGSAASRTPSAHTAATHPPTRGGADSLPEHTHPSDMDNSPTVSSAYAPVSALSSAAPSPAPAFAGHNVPPVPAGAHTHSGVPAAIIPGAGAGAAMGAAGAAAPPARVAELSNANAPSSRWHSDNAAEIDSQPAMSHQSGPVYEMGS